MLHIDTRVITYVHWGCAARGREVGVFLKMWTLDILEYQLWFTNKLACKLWHLLTNPKSFLER